MYKNISYFKGLNALRFFAASLVVLHHTATIGKKDGLFDLCDWGLFRNGANAVNFFFVLSGFLITYLLLKEHDQTGTISIKQFYLRRVRRIWPLYFLLIIIGTLLLPLAFGLVGIDYRMPYTLSQTWYYFLFFFPILVLFHYGHHFLEPLWSIGVEEVFYLLWAPLFKYCRRHILAILSCIIILKLASLTLIWFFCAEDNVFTLSDTQLQFRDHGSRCLGCLFPFQCKEQNRNPLAFPQAFQGDCMPACTDIPLFQHQHRQSSLEIAFPHSRFLTLSSFIALSVPYLGDNHLSNRQEREPFPEIRWRNLLRNIHVSHGHCLSYDPLAQTP